MEQRGIDLPDPEGPAGGGDEGAGCPGKGASRGRAARLSEGPGPWSARVKGFATRAPLTLRGPLQKPAWSWTAPPKARLRASATRMAPAPSAMRGSPSPAARDPDCAIARER